MQKINKITQPFPRILTIFQRTLGMQDHNQQKQNGYTVNSMDV